MNISGRMERSQARGFSIRHPRAPSPHPGPTVLPRTCAEFLERSKHVRCQALRVLSSSLSGVSIRDFLDGPPLVSFRDFFDRR